MKFGVLILLVALCSGCVTVPKHTKEEWLSMTNHKFPGKSKDEVLKAAEKVLNLSDKGFQLSYTDDSIKAIRHAHILITSIRYTFDVKATSSGSTTNCQLGINSSVPQMSQDSPFNQLYDLFFSRMDFLLYNKNKWQTCAEAATSADSSAIFEPLCFNAADLSP